MKNQPTYQSARIITMYVMYRLPFLFLYNNVLFMVLTFLGSLCKEPTLFLSSCPCAHHRAIPMYV